ncbi:hypothetical protein HZH68_009732 [Vespula germanica]|uniref:Uncharacterized protein n=1 Tax=Vespula germanica TaxID=30212 RepID=A0A834JXX5_VESGE|nr:hypothetical protein HZH68_009732 [Vespula germanica]
MEIVDEVESGTAIGSRINPLDGIETGRRRRETVFSLFSKRRKTSADRTNSFFRRTCSVVERDKAKKYVGIEGAGTTKEEGGRRQGRWGGRVETGSNDDDDDDDDDDEEIARGGADAVAAGGDGGLGHEGLGSVEGSVGAGWQDGRRGRR